MHILILSGPNLNLLGKREPGVYGRTTLADISAALDALAGELGARLSHFQSNGEGALVDRIHAAMDEVQGIVFNPGAYTHTSVAIRDAIDGARVPVIEVHLSNVHAREPFRHHSYVSPVARGVIVGLGARGYELAIRALALT